MQLFVCLFVLKSVVVKKNKEISSIVIVCTYYVDVNYIKNKMAFPFSSFHKSEFDPWVQITHFALK